MRCSNLETSFLCGGKTNSILLNYRLNELEGHPHQSLARWTLMILKEAQSPFQETLSEELCAIKPLYIETGFLLSHLCKAARLYLLLMQ
ncbi:hypothetical protein AWW68_14550 [Roseivirga spongicola]|uniref:Uncharacterized protein n=1 Tax=Roseivirga spongicola TaxID=333140 RepID=A0A150X5A2_9BACT|nr:hypothetical protein AWW68_14550 [Roseivirga spongicola]